METQDFLQKGLFANNQEDTLCGKGLLIFNLSISQFITLSYTVTLDQSDISFDLNQKLRKKNGWRDTTESQDCKTFKEQRF